MIYEEGINFSVCSDVFACDNYHLAMLEKSVTMETIVS